MIDSITLFKPLDERVEHIENVLFHGASTLKLQVRQIRASKLGASIIQTGTSVPYVKMDADGLLIVNGLAGNAALRLKNDPTNTTTEIREAEGGLAISSDVADVCSLRLFDTAFTSGTGNRRFNLEFSALAGEMRFADNADLDTFRIYCTYSDGDTQLEGLDAGDLVLKSASAQVSCANDFEPEANTLLLGDYQRAWAGLIVLDQTDGKYYRIHTDSGAVHVTEVTS